MGTTGEAREEWAAPLRAAAGLGQGTVAGSACLLPEHVLVKKLLSLEMAAHNPR